MALLGTVTAADAVGHFQRVWWMLVACGVLTSAAALALPRPVRVVEPASGPVPVGAEG